VEGSKTVLLVGTLDTKGAEYAYLRERLRVHGVDTILADAGVEEPRGAEPDIGRAEVAAESGADPAALAEAGDRGAAVTAMAGAAEALARTLYAEGRIGAVLGAGGSGGAAIAARAMRALPVGAPKLMVSTMASGNTADYVGASGTLAESGRRSAIQPTAAQGPPAAMLDPFSLGSAREVVIRPAPEMRKPRCSAVSEALCRTRTGDPFLTMAVWLDRAASSGTPKHLHRCQIRDSAGARSARHRSAPSGTHSVPGQSERRRSARRS